MPWIDTDGDKEYKVSIYAKEELPTWSEVYEEFYKRNNFVYYPDKIEDQELDQYWKIPRLKVLLATVCNQFNKMLFEDGIKRKILKSLYYDNDYCRNPVDIRFICEINDPVSCKINWNEIFLKKNVGGPLPPPIYTIPLPSGKVNPFITSSVERININDIQTPMSVYPIISYKPDDESVVLYAPIYIDDTQRSGYMKVLDIMMKTFKDYFEGSGIGWKDANGNLIESDPMKRSCDGVGYDPAL